MREHKCCVSSDSHLRTADILYLYPYPYKKRPAIIQKDCSSLCRDHAGAQQDKTKSSHDSAYSYRQGRNPTHNPITRVNGSAYP